jgi:hypothetical protein
MCQKTKKAKFAAGLLLGFLCLRSAALTGAESAPETSPLPEIQGLTGRVDNVRVAVAASQVIAPLSDAIPQHDIDLRRMAAWAMNYLIRTPNQALDYEPVFQCHPLRCPPVPQGQDVVVPCDTDARMNWEWYYMRDITGSSSGRDVEEGFHKRMLAYLQDDGTVLCPPGCYNEGDINKVYHKSDYVYHVWGATKILLALAEDFRRTGNKQSRDTARKIMLRLKKAAIYPTPDKCYLPAGMGPLRQDGTVISNYWNRQPAPLVEPLVNYYLATGDKEALDFARAYAEGIMAGLQPGAIRIGADGNFGGGHGHATLHALWGIAHLGLVTGQPRYVDFVKKSWDWMLTQGTGTGWFPAAPIWADNCNETCCISDMISIAALIGRSGHAEYFDYVERYLRNYISNLQFIVTPEFEAYYRKINAAAGPDNLDRGLADLRKFQGGIIGGSGLNDYENRLLGGASGFEMFGCCAPEGMRAIYTSWDNVITRLPRSELGPAGIYVNMGLGRDSKWGRVVSFYPDAGRLTVKAGVKDRFFLRPPHWSPRGQVRAFVGTKSVPVEWSGAYVRFDKVAPGDEITVTYPLLSFTHEVEGLWRQFPKVKMTFQWLGNSVISCQPPPEQTPLFRGGPRLLPTPPLEDFARNQDKN